MVTHFFKFVVGFLQGDILTPYLFTLVLDYTMCQAVQGKEADLWFKPDKKSCHHKLAIITNMITGKLSQAEELLSKLKWARLACISMQITKKMEMLQFNQETQDQIYALGSPPIIIIQYFKYLGCWMSNLFKDFEVRRALTWSAWNKLLKV